MIERIPQVRSDTPTLVALGCNDKISSMRCGPGTTVEVFVDAQYKGASERFSGDVPSMGKLNDKVRKAPPHSRARSNLKFIDFLHPLRLMRHKCTVLAASRRYDKRNPSMISHLFVREAKVRSCGGS